jgi:hypothetical protein
VSVIRSAVALVLVTCCWTAYAQTYDVAAELWDRPRTADVVRAQDGIKRAVSDLLASPDAQLVIHHARSQEPELQAEEIRSWLAALAIDSRRIALRADLDRGAPIRIEVTP